MREYNYFNASVVMLVFIYLKSMQPVTITVKKSTGGFQFDYATYWVLTGESSHIYQELFGIIQFDSLL